MNGPAAADDDDAERDAWLRSALRHAPDAGLGPPEALGRSILQAARAQARARDGAPRGMSQAPSRAGWPWHRAGGRVPAALGALAVTALVAIVWRGGLPDAPHGTPDGDGQASIGSRTAPVAARQADAPSPTPGAPGAPAAGPSPAAAEQPPSPRVAAVAPRPREPVSSGSRPTQAAADAAPVRRRAASAPAPAAARGEAMADASAASAGRAAAPDAEEAPVHAASPPAAMPSDEALADAASLRGADVMLRMRSLGPASPLPALLQQELLADRGRWTWQADAGTPRPVDDAMLRWLARLDAVTASRWAAAGVPASEPSGLSVQWLRDGRPRYRLRLLATRAVWEVPSEAGTPRHAARAWSAPLDAAESAALREALE